MRQFYQNVAFHGDTRDLIETMNLIIDDYTKQGYRLTVRQLYYQLVARAVIPNTERSYKRVTSVVNDARLAGIMDWDAIEDRTRAFVKRPSWDSGSQILQSVANQFHMDLWEGQDRRVFVVVEKEALAGVLERVCHDLDMPLLAARGYPSGTVLREFAVADLATAYAENQICVILHLGDHDPSGIDMTRDLTQRLEMFNPGEPIELIRIALNMDQIKDQSPPPNPAKTTDSRFEDYARIYGDESWELDALKPEFLVALVRKHARRFIDEQTWNNRVAEIKEVRRQLTKVAEEFEA